MEWRTEQIIGDARFLPLGRRDERQDPLRLFWTGSGLAMQSAARRLSARIEADYALYTPWMCVAVDGAPVARFPLRAGAHDYDLLTGMDETVPHRVTLTLDTQPMEDDARLTARILRVTADGELLDVEKRPRIEFIGDSLTTGEGLAGPVGAEEWRTVWMCGAMTYAAQACALLRADGEWVSQSGWGVLSDWTGDRRHTLPAVYSDVCALSPAGRIPYDFAAHPVSAVVVNLGTNDMSALRAQAEADRPGWEADLTAAVKGFCAKITAARPGVPLLWICGMCGTELNALLSCAVSEAAAELSSPVAFRGLMPCPPEQIGSRQHPGWLSHRDAACAVAEGLKALGAACARKGD